MASKVKIAVSLDKGLAKELAAVSGRISLSRSRLIEEAVRSWQGSLLEQQLKEGYQHMAIEDRATAKRYLGAGWEIVK